MQSSDLVPEKTNPQIEKEKYYIKKGVELLVNKINDPRTPIHKQIMTDVLEKRSILYIYPCNHFWARLKSNYKYWRCAFRNQAYVNELLISSNLPKNISAKINDRSIEIFNSSF